MTKIMNSVMCYGTFDVLHPGHDKIIKFCGQFGKQITVVLSGSAQAKIPTSIRKKNIQSVLSCNELISLDNTTLLKVITERQPKYLIVGAEFKDSRKSEIIGIQEILTNNGGNLIYFENKDAEKISSDKIDFLDFLDLSLIKETMASQGLDKSRLLELIKLSKKARIVVIGDTIIDRYVQTAPIGLSSEAPVVVVKELSSEDFVGGAGVVALHVSSVCKDTSFISVAGKDAEAVLLNDVLLKNKIKPIIFSELNRPTTLKTRFVAQGQKLLRLSRLDDSAYSDKFYAKTLETLFSEVERADRVIFSDFSYGVLSEKFIDSAKKLFESDAFTKFAGDSQSGSQTGNIGKFVNFNAIYPTEYEARLYLKDFSSSIDVIGRNLLRKLNVSKVFLKLNAEGLLIFYKTKGEERRAYLPAFAKRAVDVTGAGDTLLAVSNAILSKTDDVISAGFLGSIAAAIAVSRMGNASLSHNEVYEVINNI